MTPFRPLPLALLAASFALASCGGGGGGDDDDGGGSSDDPKVQAVLDTVDRNPACSTGELGSYYWEIGDADGRIASDRVGDDAPGADTTLKVASASKWVYAAYVAEKRGGALRDGADVPFLNFTSGYDRFVLPTCGPGNDGTVADCIDGERGEQDADAVGKFAYNSGHMQRHAAVAMQLGELDRAALASEVGGTLGVPFGYSDVQLAATVETTPATYASFLRKIVRGDLQIASLLGHDAVCASEDACPAGTVVHSPQSERVWHYSLGHWVEDDPASGDGAFSSAGALGFYPWISADKTLYGVVAREVAGSAEQEGFKSAICGAAIRKAYLSGRAQTGG